MLGPLPRRYRRLVATVAVVLSTALGGWFALTLDLPLPADGLLVGTAVGVALAFLLVHDFSRRAARRAQTARVARRP